MACAGHCLGAAMATVSRLPHQFAPCANAPRCHGVACAQLVLPLQPAAAFGGKGGCGVGSVWKPRGGASLTSGHRVIVMASPDAGTSTLVVQDVEFVWKGSGSTVLLSGDFVNWESQLPLEKTGSDGWFVVKQKLSPGTYKYKYIVDGEWKHSPDYPTVSDNAGGFNNEITVAEDKSSTESTSKESTTQAEAAVQPLPAPKEAGPKPSDKPKAAASPPKPKAAAAGEAKKAAKAVAEPLSEETMAEDKSSTESTSKESTTQAEAAVQPSPAPKEAEPKPSDKPKAAASPPKPKDAAAGGAKKAAKAVAEPLSEEAMAKDKSSTESTSKEGTTQAEAAVQPPPAPKEAEPKRSDKPKAAASPPKPKAAAAKKAAKKAVAKPLPEAMAEDIVPNLTDYFEKEKGISDVEIKFDDNQLQGRFLKNQVPYNFWAYFPDGKFEGSRGFSLTSHGSPPSTVEPFLIDESKISSELVVQQVIKRLFAQRLLGTN